MPNILCEDGVALLDRRGSYQQVVEGQHISLRRLLTFYLADDPSRLGCYRMHGQKVHKFVNPLATALAGFSRFRPIDPVHEFRNRHR